MDMNNNNANFLLRKINSMDDVIANHSFMSNSCNAIANTNKKDLDYPPFSRLFVLYPKSAAEIELKELFENYGPVEDVWIVREKETGLSKGLLCFFFICS
jgi:hypothetical protein